VDEGGLGKDQVAVGRPVGVAALYNLHEKAPGEKPAEPHPKGGPPLLDKVSNQVHRGENSDDPRRSLEGTPKKEPESSENVCTKRSSRLHQKDTRDTDYKKKTPSLPVLPPKISRS